MAGMAGQDPNPFSQGGNPFMPPSGGQGNPAMPGNEPPAGGADPMPGGVPMTTKPRQMPGGGSGMPGMPGMDPAGGGTPGLPGADTNVPQDSPAAGPAKVAVMVLDILTTNPHLSVRQATLIADEAYSRFLRAEAAPRMRNPHEVMKGTSPVAPQQPAAAPQEPVAPVQAEPEAKPQVQPVKQPPPSNRHPKTNLEVNQHSTTNPYVEDAVNRAGRSLEQRRLGPDKAVPGGGPGDPTYLDHAAWRLRQWLLNRGKPGQTPDAGPPAVGVQPNGPGDLPTGPEPQSPAAPAQVAPVEPVAETFAEPVVGPAFIPGQRQQPKRTAPVTAAQVYGWKD